MGQISGAVGDVFGHSNPKSLPYTAGGAPTAVPGVVGATGPLPGASGGGTGLTGRQQFARKALQGGLQGLGQGLQQPRMQGGMAPPINVPQAPAVDPSFFGVGKPKNPFFGG